MRLELGPGCHCAKITATRFWDLHLGMAIDGLLAIFGTQLDLTPLLRGFWSGGEVVTTAERANEMGRLSGVFNQTAEAGVAYGIAGLLAIYLHQTRPLRMVLFISLITAGGFYCR